MTIEQYRTALTTVILDHLAPLGYPNLTEEQILAEIPKLWELITEKNLVLPGMSYEGFVASAMEQAAFSKLMGQMERLRERGP
jgi:hypothetical protein